MVRVFSTQVDVVKQTVSELATSVKTVPSESVEFINAVQTGSVASGTEEVVTIQPPAGFLYELLLIRATVSSDADATSGKHKLMSYSETESIRLFKGESNYNTPLRFKYDVWQDADISKMPSTEAAQSVVLKEKRIDENNGIIIRYKNETDAAQENDRFYTLWVRKIMVA